MTYKDFITLQCATYAKLYSNAVFLGYNVAYGSKMYGTLEGISKEQLLETPVAENLMMGMALGMALEGYRPVVCFERHDFVLIALDSLVNHLDKMPVISGGQFKFPVIVRAIVGAGKPLNAGMQHTQDYTEALKTMLKNTLVMAPKTREGFITAWSSVGKSTSGGIVIVEHRDLYEMELG